MDCVKHAALLPRADGQLVWATENFKQT